MNHNNLSSNKTPLTEDGIVTEVSNIGNERSGVTASFDDQGDFATEATDGVEEQSGDTLQDPKDIELSAEVEHAIDKTNKFLRSFCEDVSGISEKVKMLSRGLEYGDREYIERSMRELKSMQVEEMMQHYSKKLAQDSEENFEQSSSVNWTREESTDELSRELLTALKKGIDDVSLLEEDNIKPSRMVAQLMGEVLDPRTRVNVDLVDELKRRLSPVVEDAERMLVINTRTKAQLDEISAYNEAQKNR